MTAAMAAPLTARAYQARETAVSAVVSSAISAAFMFGVFGMAGSLPVPGMGNFAFDFVPQSGGIALMGCLVPSLLARNAIASGKVVTPLAQAPGISATIRQSVLWAIAGLGIGALASFVLAAGGMAAIGWLPALLIKIIYGAALGAIVTQRVLSRLFRG